MDSNHLIEFGFAYVHCIEATGDPGNDEPYCVFFVAENISSALPVPKGIVFRTKVFKDDEGTNDGDTSHQWVPLWNLKQQPAPISNPADIIVLAALIENDDSDPNAVTSTMQATLTASLVAAKSANYSRAEMVTKLAADMFGAMGIGIMSGGLNSDERIGYPKEVVLTTHDINQARNGHRVEKVLNFQGDGGSYDVGFYLNPNGVQTNWRWCHKCQGLYFAGNPGSRCPAGGAHDHSGSGNYGLNQNLNVLPAYIQTNWRWCNKCQGLYYGGNAGSKCPAGGAHSGKGSGNYSLLHDVPGATSFQQGWRWCRKCQGLYFVGHSNGVCPAGQQHDDHGSAAYELFQSSKP